MGRPMLGVAGFPVSHSRSPAMHTAALAQMGLEWDYVKVPVPPELFAETVRALPASGFRGLNVTVPHKQAALELADTHSAAAGAIGAANTLSFADGAIAAENTDAPGFLAALGQEAHGLRATVLGAGGSARAVAWALADAGAARVAVVNRTAERAGALAADLGVDVDARPEGSDVLVNCTSVGLAGEDAGRGAGGAGTGRHGPAGGGGGPGLRGRSHSRRALGARGRCPLRGRAGGAGAPGGLSLHWWTGREAPLDVMRAAVA